MKKIFFALFSGIALMLAFASCNKYEEAMYNKSAYQIQYLWYKSNTGDPNETFVYDKKKMLSQINIIDSSDLNNIHIESFEFTYNKDKTVQSISHVNNEMTETVAFTYLNKYVKYMTYSINGGIRMTSNFYRDDEEAAKITRIVEIYDHAFFEDMHLLTKALLYNRFIGDREKLKDLAAANTKALTLYCNKTITYEGDNIVKIEEFYPDIHKKIITTRTFGDVLNPYYGLNYCYANNLSGFSKNAPTNEVISTIYDGNISYTENIDYQYFDVNKDRYPRVFKHTSSNRPGVFFKTYITYVSEYKD
ncbi:MAG: hypothetical protein J5644_10735 [Bacteroidales bacterium]|nr:hypothetical protein [Bacteroidales bacterium]